MCDRPDGIFSAPTVSPTIKRGKGTLLFGRFTLQQKLPSGRWVAKENEKLRLLDLPPSDWPGTAENISNLRIWEQSWRRRAATFPSSAANLLKVTTGDGDPKAAIVWEYHPGFEMGHWLQPGHGTALPEQIIHWLTTSCPVLPHFLATHNEVDWLASFVCTDPHKVNFFPLPPWSADTSNALVPEKLCTSSLIHVMSSTFQKLLASRPTPKTKAEMLVQFLRTGTKAVSDPSDLPPLVRQLGKSWWEESQRWKLVSDKRSGFWLMTTPVTVGEWRMIRGKNPPESFAGMTEHHPALGMSYLDATKFAQEMNHFYHAAGILPPDRRLRLPKLAEWQQIRNTIPRADLHRHCWNEGLKAHTNNKLGRPREVASKDPSDGFYDIAGNAGQWCLKRRDQSVAPVAGGSWRHEDDCEGPAVEKPIDQELPWVGLRLLAEKF